MPTMLGSIGVMFSANTSGLMSGINTAKNALGQFASGNILGGVGTILTGVATAAVGFGAASVSAAANFQQSMLKVQAYAGLSKQQTDAMSNSILTMASQLGQSPKAMADAIYPIISSGYSASQALDILNLSAKTAAASGADMSVVADMLTTSLKASGAPASQAGHYMDMFNKIVAEGKGEVPAYAAVIGKLTLAASSAHVPFDQMGAALATLTTHGFPSVAQASNALGNLFTQIGPKVDTLATHAQKLGLSFNESAFKSMDLSDKLAYLTKITGGNQGELLKLVGGSTLALKAFDSLSSSTKDFTTNLQGMQDAAGTTDSVFATASQGFNASVARMQASIQVLMIKVGQALLPVVTALVNHITPLVTGFANWITQSNILQNTISFVSTAFQWLGTQLATLQPIWTVLTTAFRAGATVLQQIGQAFHAVFSSATTLLVNTHAAAQPLLDTFDRATGVFHTVTTAAKPLLDTFDRAPLVLKPITDTVKPLLDTFDRATGVFHNTSSSVHTVTNAFNPFIPIVRQVVGDVQGLMQAFFKMTPAGNLFDALSRHAQDLGKWFQTSVVPAIKQAEPGFAQLGRAVLGLIPVIEKIADIVHNSFQKAFDALLPVFEKAVPIIIRVAGIIADGLGKAIQFLAPYVVQAAAAIGKFADEIIQRVAPIISQWFDGLNAGLNFLEANWKYIWPVLSTILKGIWDMIVGVIKIAWAIVSGIIKVGLDLLSGNWGQAWKDIKDMFAGIWDGITTYFSGAWEVLKGLFMGMITAIIGVFQHLFDVLIGHSIVPDMVNGIVQWFSQLPGRVMSWIGNMASSLTGAFTHLASQALTWGSDLIGNLISGIGSQLGNLGNMASNVAATIAKYIHFSKPDAGPLASISEWMPDMGTLLAQGLQAQVGKLGTVSLSLAHAIAGPTGTLGIAGSGGQFSAQQSNQPVYLQIDGKTFAELLAPHMGKAQQRMTVRSTGRGW